MSKTGSSCLVPTILQYATFLLIKIPVVKFSHCKMNWHQLRKLQFFLLFSFSSDILLVEVAVNLFLLWHMSAGKYFESSLASFVTLVKVLDSIYFVRNHIIHTRYVSD